MTPDERTPDQQAPPLEATLATPQTVEQAQTGPGWFHRLSSVLFIIFCFELGLFLVVYPWTDAWTENYLSLLAPAKYATTWRMIWNNSYLRGGMSGVGLANIWIAVAEVFRMFTRRAGKAD